MIYLIGGSPRCGKTTFAKMLVKEKGLPRISTDLIAAMIKPYLSETDANAFGGLNACTEPSEKLLSAEIQNAKILWPGIKQFLLSLTAHHLDYIVEGVHLFPEFIAELQSIPEWKDAQNEIRIVYLVKKDISCIVDGLQKADPSSDWLLQCIQTAEHMQNAANMIRSKSVFLENEALKYHFNVINTGNDFEKTLQNLLHTF